MSSLESNLATTKAKHDAMGSVVEQYSVALQCRRLVHCGTSVAISGIISFPCLLTLPSANIQINIEVSARARPHPCTRNQEEEQYRS